jgi:hypothetical protein
MWWREMRRLLLAFCFLASGFLFVSLAEAALTTTITGADPGCLKTAPSPRVQNGGDMATIQIFSKDLQDLLISFKTDEDWQLEGLEDVETLTDIIREAGSVEIARAIIQFMKKYGYGYSNSRRVGN